MDSLTRDLLIRVLPLMEQHTIETTTSTLQHGAYTYTLTITKQPVTLLGKRRHTTEQMPERNQREWRPSIKEQIEWEPKQIVTDVRLFNNMGHNFCPAQSCIDIPPRATSPTYIS